MNLRTMGTRRTAALVNAAVMLAGAAGAAADPVRADGPQHLIAVETTGLASMLIDAKDKPLADALALIPARIRELPGEAPDMPPQAAGMINLALATVARPMRFAIVANPDNPVRGAFGYGAVVSLQTPNQEHAAQMHGMVNGALGQANLKFNLKPSDTWRGMNDIQHPFAIVSYGPRQSAGQWRYEVLAGSIESPDAPFETWSTPAAGFKTVARAKVNFAALAPAMQMAKNLAEMQNPQAAAQLSELEDSVLLGADAPRYEVHVGYTETEMVSVGVISAAKKHAATLGLPTRTVTADELATIPADANSAGVSRFDLAWIGGLIDKASEAGAPVQAGLDQFEAQTGVNLRTDIIDAIGGTVIHYSADSTGGGSLLSGVCLVSFKDRERFAAANAKLVGVANAMAQQVPNGRYVRASTWNYDGQSLVSIRFPGLPVPFEVSWAMTDRWLVLGFTPQSVIAAARQATGKGDAGIASNPAFAAAMPKGKEVVSMKFTDTVKAMRGGYAMTTLLGTAVANLVRSPMDPGREPGLLVPPFNDLKNGAKAQVKYSYWRGEDLVTESHADRSMLVNLSASAGSMMQWAPLMAIPALGAAAQQGRLGMDLRQDVLVLALASSLLALPETVTREVWARSVLDAVCSVGKVARAAP